MHVLAFTLLLAAGTLQTAIARHPLYPVLQQYDREIAALRATQNRGELRDPADASDRAADRVQAGSFAAQHRIETLLVARGDEFSKRDNAALDALSDARSPWAAPQEVRSRIGRVYAGEIARVRAGSSQSLARYRTELDRQNAQAFAAFAASTAQTTRRALAARAQQFAEKESTLAFDLEKAHAGHRLSLALALADLHRDAATRRKLRAQIGALDGGVARKVAQLHASDEVQLSAYRAKLESAESSADAAMAQRLRKSSASNLALRGAIAKVQATASTALPSPRPEQSSVPSVAARARALRGSYRFASDAAAISSAFSAASDELAQRFTALANRDRSSRALLQSQIATLERQRRELYLAILRDVRRGKYGL